MRIGLIMLGIIVGVGLLTMLGCFLYYYEEDKKLDLLFWNNLAEIYLDANLYYDCRKCLSMAEDILEGVTGRSDRTPFYIPRGSIHN